MNKQKRTEWILSLIDGIPCIKGWSIGKLLGTGTVGTVFLVCTREKECAAMKIQLLSSKKATKQFEMEIKNQESVEDMAPRVLDTCIHKVGKVKLGVIIMERLGEELDSYLVPRRSAQELKHIGEQIEDMLGYMKQKGFTHGDLALFNLAFLLDDPTKLVMLDFDRASTTVYAPEVDSLRLQTELYKTTQSNGTKPIHKDNMTRLRKFIPVWHKKVGTRVVKGVKKADGAWIDAYESYCKEANVQCL
jgi:predicted Ser/Thr protein kinase